jgi:hypothetical protein
VNRGGSGGVSEGGSGGVGREECAVTVSLVALVVRVIEWGLREQLHELVSE